MVAGEDLPLSSNGKRMIGRGAGSKHFKHFDVVEVAAWSALLETESSDPEGGENANAAALVVELAKASEKIQITVVWQDVMVF